MNGSVQFRVSQLGILNNIMVPHHGTAEIEFLWPDSDLHRPNASLEDRVLKHIMKLLLRLILIAVVLTALSPCLNAQEEKGESRDAAAGPFGRFVTIKTPISDQTVSLINNTAVELQAQAVRESRQAILVLEVESGSSRFGQVRDIASFLTSAELSDVRTIAWIPKTVEGNHAVLALACHEIILHPDASLHSLIVVAITDSPAASSMP